MAPIVLRNYQQRLLDDLRSALRIHRRVCAVMPTGAGKGQTIGAIVQGAAAKGRRVLVLAHRAELIDQLVGTVRAWGLEPDVIVPGHRLQGLPVAVGSVQTVARRLEQLPTPDLIIQDEAHHLVAGNLWGRIISHWLEAHLIGKTATPERLDGKGLGVDAGGFFEALVLGPSAAWLVEQGWLARPRVFTWPGARNSKLRRRMGDFDLEQAARAYGERAAMGDAVSHYRHRLHPGTAICFCCTIQHAEQMAAAFRDAGVRAAAVSGGTSAEERKRLIAGLGTGEVEVLTSCSIVSEGTDIPSVGGAILMRPTASLSLYLQMIGRALRPAPGKQEAVILDHVGNAHRHGLPTDEREWSLEGRKKRESKSDSQPLRVCPSCLAVLEAVADPCPLCQTPKPSAPKQRLARVEGDLVEAEESRQEEARERRQEVRKARTREDLEEIARQRGYKPGWVKVMLKLRSAH